MNTSDDELAKAIDELYFDFSVSREEFLALIHDREAKAERRGRDNAVFDLDEIDNKPWRVFRQLAKIMPEYAETYRRYEAFYAFGGGVEVKKLIEAFEKTADFKESFYPEIIATAQSEQEGSE